jgi:protein TonB
VEKRKTGFILWLLQRLAVLVMAVAAVLAIFLVLPVMQTIGSPAPRDLYVRGVDIANLPPPPPPPPEEEQKEEEAPEEPPELVEQAQPLDLSELELALNPGYGEGLFGDFTVTLFNQLQSGEGGEEIDRIFSLSDLDQEPRVIFQRTPNYPPELRRSKRQGKVIVVFLVDTRGRVINPRVEKSTDPAFERAALDAIKQWRFEPGTRNGEKVQFKMRQPFSFNAS